MSVNYNGDYSYAQEKLLGSTVSWGNKLVTVLKINPEGLCHLQDLFYGEYFDVPLKELNLEPFPLGYVNEGNICLYLSRLPVRYYKQGLKNNTLGCSCSVKRNVHFNINKSLLAPFRDLYPPLEKCIEFVFNLEKISCAFSKTFGVVSHKDNIKLEYKSKMVGNVNCKTDEITLDNKFLFLEDSLKSCL